MKKTCGSAAQTACALLNAQSHDLKASSNISTHPSIMIHLHVSLCLTNSCRIKRCLIIQAGNNHMSILVLFYTLPSTLLNHILQNHQWIYFTQVILKFSYLVWWCDACTNRTSHWFTKINHWSHLASKTSFTLLTVTSVKKKRKHFLSIYYKRNSNQAYYRLDAYS